jgi:hypothetical protein
MLLNALIYGKNILKIVNPPVISKCLCHLAINGFDGRVPIFLKNTSKAK